GAQLMCIKNRIYTLRLTDAYKYRHRRQVDERGSASLRSKDKTCRHRRCLENVCAGEAPVQDFETGGQGAILGRDRTRTRCGKLVILVDSSVWIDHFRNTLTDSVAHLRRLVDYEALLVGDLILCEVLCGVRSERQARMVEANMRQFEVVSLSDPELAVKA